MDFKVRSKIGLHFEKVRRTGGQSLISSCGLELQSQWTRPIDDEATMMFMKSFYQHLEKGNTASGALHQSMKSFRESEKYSEMRKWASFQLIGDNVKIEFEAVDDVKK